MPRVILKKRSETTKQVRFGGDDFGGDTGGDFGGDTGGGSGNTGGGNTGGGSGNTGGGSGSSNGVYYGDTSGDGQFGGDDQFGGETETLPTFGEGKPTVGPDIGDITNTGIPDEFNNIGNDGVDTGFEDFDGFEIPDPTSFDPDNAANYNNAFFWQETSADPEAANKVVDNLDENNVKATNQDELATTINENVDIEKLKCAIIENLTADFFTNLNTDKLIKMTSIQLDCISETGASGLSDEAIEKLKDEKKFKYLKKDVRDSLNNTEDTKTNQDTNDSIKQQDKDKAEQIRKKADQNTDDKPRLSVNNPIVSEGYALNFVLTLTKPLRENAIIKAEILSTGSARLGNHYDQVNTGIVYSDPDAKITVKENDKEIKLTPLQHINSGDDLNISISAEQVDNILLSIRTVYLDDDKKNGVTIKIKFTCVDENNDSLIYENKKGDGVIATGTITDLKKKEEETEKKIENGEWKVEIKGSMSDDRSYTVTSANELMTNDKIVTFIQNNAKINDTTNLSDYNPEDINNSITSIKFRDYTEIPNKLLQDCENLTTITIPESVNSIGNYAFSNTGIRSYKVNSHVKKLGTHVFYNCQELTSIWFDTPELDLQNTNSNLRSILPSSICHSCTSLTSVTLNENIKAIDAGAFNGCRNLKISGLNLSNIEKLFSNALENCGQNYSDDTFTIPKNISLLSQNILSGTSVTTIDATNITNFDNAGFHRNGKTFDGLVDGITVKLSSDTEIPRDNDNFSATVFYGATVETFMKNEKVVQIGTDNNYYARITGERNDKVYEIDLQSNDNRITKIRDAIKDTTTLDADINNTIKTVTFNKCPDNEIPDNAFSGCTGLTDVTIGNTVTSIGNKAFYSCSALASITIPDGVTTIGVQAFQECTSLTEMEIPDTVTTIWSGIFWQCTGLKKVIWNSSINKIPRQTFYGCSSLTEMEIPNTVTTIDKSAFRDCSSLVTNIPTTVTTIGSDAFKRCSKLATAIPTTVTSIGDTAFGYCTSLIFSIPESLTKIENQTFIGCSATTSVTIPDNITSIGDRAFGYCTGLTEVTIDENSTIDDNNLGLYIFHTCEALVTVTFPKNNNINTIKNRWFYSCKNLISVNNLNNITTIEEFAFAYCSKIRKYINGIIEKVEKIGDSAFVSTNMTEITLSSITEMHTNALTNINYSNNITVKLPNSNFFKTYKDEPLTSGSLKEFYGEIPNNAFIIEKSTKSLGRKRRIIIR